MSDYIDFGDGRRLSRQQLLQEEEDHLKSAAEKFLIYSEGTILAAPRGYGWVLFIALCSYGFVFNTWFRVIQARRDYKIPNLVRHSEQFWNYNCVYRAYKSTQEQHVRLVFYLFFSGLEWPAVSTVATIIWMFGRYFYCKGYYSGEPEKRRWGWWHCIGYHILQIGCIRFALKHLY